MQTADTVPSPMCSATKKGTDEHGISVKLAYPKHEKNHCILLHGYCFGRGLPSEQENKRYYAPFESKSVERITMVD